MKYHIYLLSALCVALSLQAKWVKKSEMSLKYIMDFSLNNAQNIWATSRGTVYKWEMNKWRAKGKKDLHPKLISVAADNTPYAITVRLQEKGLSAKILKFEGTEWKLVHTFADGIILSFTAVNSNDMWILKRDKAGVIPYHWNGKAWEAKGSVPVFHLRVGADGTVMGVSMEETAEKTDLYFVEWDGKEWKKLYTFKEQVFGLGVADKNNIWVAKSKDESGDLFLYKWDPKSTRWIEKGKMAGIDLIVGRDGSLWSTLRDDVYQWQEDAPCEKGALPEGPCRYEPGKKAVAIPEAQSMPQKSPAKELATQEKNNTVARQRPRLPRAQIRI